MKVITVNPQMIKGKVDITEDISDIGIFFMVGGAIGNDIKICCDFDYKKMYASFFLILEQFGYIVEYFDDGFKVKSGANMVGWNVNWNGVKEHIPAISVLCAFRKGESQIKGIPVSERKILKETASELSHLGAKTEITSDGILINGSQILRCDGAYAWGNPYLAMALIIAGSRCEGELRVTGIDELEYDKFNTFLKIYEKLIKENE